MSDVVTFGEGMIRLAPPNKMRLEQTGSLEMTVGGAELNVAAGVSRLGLTSSWVSSLPANGLGRRVRNRAREFGVDTSHVCWDEGGRVGIFYVEYGASPRASSVLYDRAGSSFCTLRNAAFDWPAIFEGARAYHTTGITTALGEATAEQVARSLTAARAAGLTTSYDLNFRQKLWTPAKARSIQEPLMELVDVLVTTEEDAEVVFGITGSDYSEVARRLADRFGFKIVTITIRGDLSVLHNTWTAIACADGKIVDDRVYDLELVDRVGGGDAYAAGFIYGLLTGDVTRGVRYGNAFSAIKQASWDDFNFATLAEVEAQLKGAGSRIVR
jgi:2-dehydro-3-deoxygluconokinase